MEVLNRKDKMRMVCVRRVWCLKVLRTWLGTCQNLYQYGLSAFSQGNGLKVFMGPHRKTEKDGKQAEGFHAEEEKGQKSLKSFVWLKSMNTHQLI